ncbi:MAG: hypothetical protein IPM36_23300 [Lewinellaceae bacterium]|nr:hypothetical protein [Lewinellaceae bacterium]
MNRDLGFAVDQSMVPRKGILHERQSAQESSIRTSVLNNTPYWASVQGAVGCSKAARLVILEMVLGHSFMTGDRECSMEFLHEKSCCFKMTDGFQRLGLLISSGCSVNLKSFLYFLPLRGAQKASANKFARRIRAPVVVPFVGPSGGVPVIFFR